jgi:hypothetical protein
MNYKVKCIAFGTILLMLSGCGSKTLTESRARSLVQARMDLAAKATGQDGLLVDPYELTATLNNRYPQKLTSVGMRRVVGDGYIEEQTPKAIYPDLTGNFHGQWVYPWLSSVSFIVDITVNSQNRPPMITANYTGRCGGSQLVPTMQNCQTGSCQGLQPEHGVISLSCSTTFNSGTTTNVVGLDLNPQADQNRITGNFRLQYATVVTPNVTPMSLEGAFNRKTIEQEQYVYVWSKKFPADLLFANRFIRLDDAAVDSCENLLLQTETTASCTCKWHSNLSKPLTSMYGKNRLDGTIQATFGKQPDGNWMVTNVNHDIEKYDVSK